jgi:hypothetical protein
MNPIELRRPPKRRRVRAAELLSRAVHLRRDFAAAHALSAYVLLELDDPEAALLSLRRAVDLCPDNETYQDFLLETLATWEADSEDYPDPGAVSVPECLSVAYAVFHPECGCREFIVDGSTQECQRCGSMLFRTVVASYRLSESTGE